MRLSVSKQFWTGLHRHQALLYVTLMTGVALIPSHPLHGYAPWIFVGALAAFVGFLALSGLHIGIALVRVWAAKPLRPRQQAGFHRLQIGR